MSEPSQTESTQPNPAPAPEPAQAAPSPAIPAPDGQLEAAKKEAASNYDRYMRAVADMENFRKRTAREKDELRQFAAANVVEDIIPILDNLSLGLAAAKQQTDVKPIVEGVTLVLEQFKSTLGRHGLKEVNPLGQPFDHNLHECISHQPSPDAPAETVSQVVRLGYTLNGRLLRPASVVVSSGPDKPEEAKS
jgi:molecular chaperone GrpE